MKIYLGVRGQESGFRIQLWRWELVRVSGLEGINQSQGSGFSFGGGSLLESAAGE